MLALLSEVAQARGIPLEPLVSAVEEALIKAYSQQSGGNCLAQIDRETGTASLWERRTVVEVLSDPKTEIARSSAPRGFEVGDFLDVPVDPAAFSRLASLTAKQIVALRVIEHERERVFSRYRAVQEEGGILECLVQRVEHGRVYVLVDECNEAVLPYEEHSVAEGLWINDRIRCAVDEVRKTTKGPAIFLSRTSAAFFRGLIGDEVQTAGRHPGRITKIVARNFGKTVREMLRLELRGEPVAHVRPYEDFFEQLEAAFYPVSVSLHDRQDLGIVLAVCPEDDFEVSALDAALYSRMFGRQIVATTAAEAGALVASMEAQAVAPEPDGAPATLSAEALATLERFARERHSTVE